MEKEIENDNSTIVEPENNDSLNIEPETPEEPQQEEGESKEEFTDREKQYFSRIKKLEAELKEAKGDGKTKPKKTESSDEVTIARLEARGILHPDDQAYVLKFAKNEDMHYLEALEDELVKDKLDRNKKLRLSAQAAPRGNNRAPGAQNDVDAAVKKFEKDGTLPDNPALIAKVMKALKTR